MAEAVTADALRAFAALLERVPRAERQRIGEAFEILARVVIATES